MKKKITSICALTLILVNPILAAVTILLPPGNTNSVAGPSTNFFSGNVIAGNPFATDLAVSWSFAMAQTNACTNYLQVDTAISAGFWQTNAFVTNLTVLNAGALTTNTLNFNIHAKDPSGGMLLYRFSMVCSNASGNNNYMTNITLAVDSKTGL